MKQTNMYICRIPKTAIKKYKERADNLEKS